ncbi:MAG: ring-cleaving dioxygenase [Chloroflexota bacterium]
MKDIQGIHHITAFAKNPQANVDFYHTVLGQRLVKTTVNFDDPGTYHLYYGDEVGTPGTIMTFFPWPNAARGYPGNGEVAVTGYTIRRDSVEYWQNRFADQAIEFGDIETRFGEQVIPFKDPGGMQLELVTSEAPATIQHWAEGPIPEEHAILGFHSATLWVSSAAPTAIVLTDQMGYTFVGQEDNRWRYQGASNDIGLYVDLLERPGQPRGRMGAGSVHHIAFRTVDDEEQLEYLTKLSRAGLQVTPVQDRQYFHSIYFREPNGVLFEVATDAPGFYYDEPIAELGRSLKLPPWLEPNRSLIEKRLPQFIHPDTARLKEQA